MRLGTGNKSEPPGLRPPRALAERCRELNNGRHHERLYTRQRLGRFESDTVPDRRRDKEIVSRNPGGVVRRASPLARSWQGSAGA